MKNKNIKNKKYIILGCGGYLGSHLLERILPDKSNQVIGWDLDKVRIEEHLKSSNFKFHEQDINSNDALDKLSEEIQSVDVVIHLAAIANPSEYNTKPVDVINANFINTYKIVGLCAKHSKWLIFFSTSEVYGRTLSSYIDNNEYKDESLFLLNEDTSPLIMGPISNQRWSYACSKQLMERYVFAHHHEFNMPFTIIRPLNAFGPRMDYIPGVDGEGIPRVLACFMSALMKREPLKLVDGGTARRTIISIHDFMDAIELILSNPSKSINEIFQIGNDKNEVTMKELAEMMRSIYADITGDQSYREHPIDIVSSTEFYGEGYEDCDRRMPNLNKIKEKLGWEPKINLDDLLVETMKYFHAAYVNK